MCPQVHKKDGVNRELQPQGVSGIRLKACSPPRQRYLENGKAPEQTVVCMRDGSPNELAEVIVAVVAPAVGKDDTWV